MLPKELIFELHYLGSVEYSYTLNFSRSAAPIIGQFFNFLNLGTFYIYFYNVKAISEREI